MALLLSRARSLVMRLASLLAPQLQQARVLNRPKVMVMVPLLLSAQGLTFAGPLTRQASMVLDELFAEVVALLVLSPP